MLSLETVQTDAGAVQGEIDGDIRVFKGIPYAAAPVGPLRWRAPQPAHAWTGVRMTTRFGASCVQPTRALSQPAPFALTELEASLSEDCLFLNVWAPVDARNAPVIVSIHGGAFFMGSGSWRLTNGAVLARDGVVAVNLNYRLGVFGFFAHPELTAAANGEPATNFGILDQIAALQWVRRNITAFGGDPNNVTIRGASSGGTSVNNLMISPLSKGLFHRANAAASSPSRNATQRRLSETSPEQPKWASNGASNSPRAQGPTICIRSARCRLTGFLKTA